MHKYESLVLKALSEKNNVGLDELLSVSGLGMDEAMWALENLKSGGMVTVEYAEKEQIEISAEAKSYVKDGLPEEQLVRHLLHYEVEVADLIDETSRIGLQWAKKQGLVTISEGALKLTDLGKKAAEGGVAEGHLLKLLSANSYDSKLLEQQKAHLLNLVSRKLVRIVRAKAIQNISITKEGMVAPRYSDEGLIDRLDRSIISGETWKTGHFKKYDVGISVEKRIPAIRSPVKRLIEQIKDAYVSMGFQEISGPAVESAFWNFDSLFEPQDHPARDMQDTFYVSNPAFADIAKVPYLKRVKRVHEKSWHTKWSEDVARQMVLRTQTTSVSARSVYDIMSTIAQSDKEFELPIKLFSAGRVFRNEALDYRHLADFYQVDGVIIGKDLTLSHLFDTLKKIYAAIDIEIRFRPSYFPFVEPGAEFQAHLKDRDEWIELGGSGILREEVTGVRRSRYSVLAWGAGIERILLVKDPSLESISELYNNGLGWLRKRRLV
jgi:phenylalanyl-tRNA synthetase alpha chain